MELRCTGTPAQERAGDMIYLKAIKDRISITRSVRGRIRQFLRKRDWSSSDHLEHDSERCLHSDK